MTYEPRYGKVASNTPDGTAHTVGWTEWGDPDNRRLLLCAHGLSRNGRDFDFLAKRLAAHYRVICPDFPGRGASDWLADPAYYTNQQYLKDTKVILEELAFDSLDWVGTSMGGLIGMALAATSENLIRRMVVNDVGPFIPKAALELIKTYLKKHPRFRTIDEAGQYFRTVYAGFGRLEDHHYDHLVKFGVRFDELLDRYVLNYDPALIDVFVAAPSEDVDIWPLWEAVHMPVLVVRGGKSGLLLAETVAQMKLSKPGTNSVEFDDCAHAPSLMVDNQISAVERWLKAEGQADC